MQEFRGAEAAPHCAVTEIRYEMFQWPAPLWNRDNVARLRRVSIETGVPGGDIAVLCESIKDPRLPGCTERVRCWGRTVVRIQSNADGSCVMERLTLANPGGAIPSLIVNTTAPRLAKGWMTNFAQVCHKEEAGRKAKAEPGAAVL